MMQELKAPLPARGASYAYGQRAQFEKDCRSICKYCSGTAAWNTAVQRVTDCGADRNGVGGLTRYVHTSTDDHFRVVCHADAIRQASPEFQEE